MSGQAPPEGPEPELRLSLPAGLPSEYVPDSQVRLSLYRRLSRARESGRGAGRGRERCRTASARRPRPCMNLLSAVEIKETLRRLMAHPFGLVTRSGPSVFWS